MRFEPQFQISRNLINPRVYRSKVLSWQIIYFLFMFKEKLFLARYFGNSWENLVRWKYKILTGSTLETTKEVRLEKSRFRHIFRVRSNLILLYRCLYLFCVLKQLTKKKRKGQRRDFSWKSRLNSQKTRTIVVCKTGFLRNGFSNVPKLQVWKRIVTFDAGARRESGFSRIFRCHKNRIPKQRNSKWKSSSNRLVCREICIGSDAN